MADQGRSNFCVVFTMNLCLLELNETNVNKFAISNHMALKLDVQALKSYLSLICEYELYILPNKMLVPQRIMEKLHEGQTTPGPPYFA